MAPSPITRTKRSKGHRFSPRLESLEDRHVPAVTFLDPLTQPRFVNPLPNPLDPGFIFRPTTPGGSHYEVGVQQFQQSLGLVDPTTGLPYSTTVWGYGTATQPATYPGRTIVAQKDQPVTVEWVNRLVDGVGNPLSHLLPVDSTLHWADPLGDGHAHGPYTGPVPVVTHLHGGHNRSDSDGLPDAWFTPDGPDGGTVPDYTGRAYNRVYTYDNDQQAATLWYHDHALGVTRLNVYAGLAGYYILRDGTDTGAVGNPAGLPAGPYEVPLVIQDRMFYGPGTEDDPESPGAELPGQLYYPSAPEVGGAPDVSILPEFFGDHILVNGQAWPVLDVEPREYRFRMLNGSDSRVYELFLSTGQPIHQVGTDTGLLDSPAALDRLVIGPGERADVVIDFSAFAGQTIVVRNTAKTPFPQGAAVDPRTTGQIMAFRVSRPLNTAVPLTSVAAAPLAGPITPLVQSGATRGLLLFEGEDAYGRLQPMLGVVGPTVNTDGVTVDGTLAWSDLTTELPRVGDVEVWEFYNGTEDAHPIHLHLVSFQVLSRQRFTATVTPKSMPDGATGGELSNIRLRGQPKAPAANEAGWKDTIIVFPGEVVRVTAQFDRAGEYVWHCHILSHEDHEMMRPYEVLPALAPAASAGGQQVTPTVAPGADLVAATPTGPEPVSPPATEGAAPGPLPADRDLVPGDDEPPVLLGAAVRVYWSAAGDEPVAPSPPADLAGANAGPTRPSPLAGTEEPDKAASSETASGGAIRIVRAAPTGPRPGVLDGPEWSPGDPPVT